MVVNSRKKQTSYLAPSGAKGMMVDAKTVELQVLEKMGGL